MNFMVNVSIGEILDKYSILQLKKDILTDEKKKKKKF